MLGKGLEATSGLGMRYHQSLGWITNPRYKLMHSSKSIAFYTEMNALP
jgi:hypothetical protein